MRAVIVVMLAARVASAQPDSAPDNATAVAVFAEGQRQYQAGAYDAAASLFVRAHDIHPDPAYLFNAAQAFRNANNCGKAHEYYTRFLTLVPDAPNATEIRGHLAALAPCAKKPEVTKQPPKQAVIAPPPPRPPPPPRDRGRAKRFAGLVTIGAGVIALASGGLFTARVAAHERDADGLCTRDPNGTCEWTVAKTMQLEGYDRLGKRDRKIAIASFAAGGVAIAGGLALYVLGRTTRAESVAIVPTGDGVMAAFARSF